MPTSLADFALPGVARAPLRLTDKDSWHGHIPFAFWCIEALRPRLLVELGCHKGDSYCAFCQGVEASGCGTTCRAVDTWQGDAQAGFYDAEILRELRGYHDSRYGGFSNLVQSTFDDALPLFADGSVDLLHIDGAHGYEDVRHDFETWLPKLSAAGVVLLHDIELREKGFGVHRLWQELRERYPSFAFPHSLGLGVLAVGPSAPGPVLRLAGLDPTGAGEVREFFARLGDAVRLEDARQALARHRVRVVQQRDHIEELEALVRDRMGVVSHLEGVVRERSAVVDRLEAALRDRSGCIPDLSSSVREFSRSRELLAAQLQVAEAEVAALRAQRDAILGSSAWRLTAPLRALAGLLRPRDQSGTGTAPPSALEAPAPGMSSAAVEETGVPSVGERSEAAPVRRGDAAPAQPQIEAGDPPDGSAAPTGPGAVSPQARSDATKPASRGYVQALLSDPLWTMTFPHFDSPEVSVVMLTLDKVHLTWDGLESLQARADVPFELIVVDNGSKDETPDLLSRLRNVTVLRNEVNRGFGPACNQGAAVARGEYLLFLNNDAEIAPGCLSALVSTARTEARCGAVGGKLVWPDGRLQEAGSILWADGTAAAYGRGGDPAAPEFSYLREVDFCSGALLLVRRELFERLGRFDERFAPIYYEDVDLCVGIRSLGYRVLYQPAAVARHQEYGTTSARATELMLSNQGRFVEKRHQDLAAQPTAALGTLRGRERVSKPRVLYIDDRVPTSDVGSGYPRSHALLRLLRRQGYAVTFYPAYDPKPYQPWVREFQLGGVEVICDGRPFATFAADRAGFYDVVLVSRPHNLSTVRGDLGRAQPGAVVIYDAEALFFVREEARSEVAADVEPEGTAARQQQELALLQSAHLVITVSEREKRLLERAAPEFAGQIAVWGHPVELRPTPRAFAERRDLLFVGSFFAPQSPNVDAVRSFVAQTLPLVAERLDCRLEIVGCDAERVADLTSERVRVGGRTPDLGPFYDARRVFVVPHRFSAGIPLKLCEAMARGLPAVVSELTAIQLGVEDGQEVLVGATPEEMAEQVVRLYTDEALWTRIRENALRFVREHHDPERLGQALDDLIGSTLAAGSAVHG